MSRTGRAGILGKQLGIAHVTVAKISKRWASKPWRQETFKLSTEAELEAKIRDVIGLYLSPAGEGGGVVDRRKSPDQALHRTVPILPTGLAGEVVP